jgi:hypothetical protein
LQNKPNFPSINWLFWGNRHGKSVIRGVWEVVQAPKLRFPALISRRIQILGAVAEAIAMIRLNGEEIEKWQSTPTD